MDVEREVRFAVVMYGGVSLAIYINGVTQELLHMVRATARSAPGSSTMLFPQDKLSASEAIYREIAQLLDRQAGLEGRGDLTRTRFVVDIISGTSAGGINGVFLAKALARNQTMEGLKRLWLAEGDLGKLLNDTKAEDYSSDTGFAVEKPEKSLLNSQRMYRKLLEALAQMNEKAPAKEGAAEEQPSPFVEELDLFVTTTDIEGIPLPLRLADGVVYERRYRNVFHFRYAPDPRPEEDRTDGEDYRRDDFRKRHDPFLAFAARCTSSFPFAFDAMQLEDIKTILDCYPRYDDDDAAGKDQWDTFIKDYLRLGLIDIDLKARGRDTAGISGTVDEATAKLREAFRSRSFGDGGYLDNKPFSYATQMLMRRSATCVVERKLLYVEPTPQHPELAPRQPGPRPDFAMNVRAAVLDLPREETIREDIERIDERNEIIERVGSFAKYVDEDATLIDVPKPLTHDEFANADLREMMKRYGVSYGAYHRLKVHEITELLTCLVARAAGHDPASNAGDAIRELVASWRNDKYELVKGLGTRANGKPKETENRFLIDYDIHYRLRRLNFLNRRINQLAGAGKNNQLNSTARSLLLAWLECACKANAPADSQNLNELRVWLKKNDENRPAVTDKIPDTDKWLSDFRNELNSIKDRVAKPAQKARFTEEQFLNSKTPASTALHGKIDKLKLPWGTIELILSDNADVRRQAIEQLLGGGGLAELDSVADMLRDLFHNRTSSGLRIADPDHNDAAKGADAARLCLDHYYRNFLMYDLITYPVQYGTNSGEANVVHVYRISPEDAPSIMEERAGAIREKLAGRALMSFGAFLDESWRKNDMLWGRLDGAERLISVLLPNDTPDRENLIYRAHLGILREEILQGNGDSVCRLLSNARAHSHQKPTDDEQVERLVEAILNDEALGLYLTEERHDYLVTPQKFDRNLDAEIALKYISRSTNITGNMLEGLADLHRFDSGKRGASWVTRLGATFWNMIAVAVPQSLGNIFFRHWLGLLYLFSAVIILTGILFKSVSQLGWQLLGATVSLNLVAWLLGNFIAGKRHWIRAVRRIAIAIVAALIGFGAYFVSSNSFGFVARHDRAIGAIAGFAVLLLLGFAEWRRWLKNFLSAPTAIFSYSRLFFLTIATFAAMGLLLWIGPKEIVGLEFARTTHAATLFIARTTVPKLRFQLGADFLFIVAYAAMLASYCVAGAKLFWQRRQNAAFRLDQKRRAEFAQAQTGKKPNLADQKELATKPSWWLRFFFGLVVVGFILAGLQWVAALADATENVGLLLFLKDPRPDADALPLQIAYWAATLKFLLIFLGGAYAVVAFMFGAWKKLGLRSMSLTWQQILLRVVFVLVSLCAIGLVCSALLVCRPDPGNCLPPNQESY
jgi:patatin-related protein